MKLVNFVFSETQIDLFLLSLRILKRRGYQQSGFMRMSNIVWIIMVGTGTLAR